MYRVFTISCMEVAFSCIEFVIEVISCMEETFLGGLFENFVTFKKFLRNFVSN